MSIIQVHAIVKACKTDILNLVLAQNVEGETSQFGEDMRISANARFIFAQRHVADVMVSILKAPMIADGLTKLLSAQNKGRNVKGGFIRVFPGFAFGVKDLAVAFNSNHHLDQVPLLMMGQGGRDKDFNFAAFDPITRFGHRFLINFIRRGGFGNGLTIIEQGLLVPFDLHNDVIIGIFSCLKRFFLLGFKYQVQPGCG